jgi:hypothetical protein
MFRINQCSINLTKTELNDKEIYELERKPNLTSEPVNQLFGNQFSEKEGQGNHILTEPTQWPLTSCSASNTVCAEIETVVLRS